MRRVAGLLLPIFVILVPSMVPAIARDQSAPIGTSAVPREAMTLLLAGPENLASRPFDLRVGAVPPDFPIDVLPAGAAIQVSAGSDRVLAAVATLPRFGPDDRSALEARLFAEAIRDGLSTSDFGDEIGWGVTLSAGIARHRPGESLKSLTARADKALYAAKANGRDRVMLAEGPAPAAMRRAYAT